MEKKMRGIADIPGVLPSFHNAQLLVSTGIASLDEFIGNGVPVGTVTLIEEDTQGVYSKIILKYFLAEGIVSKHSTLLASLDVDPQNIINQLPALNAEDMESGTKIQKDDKMKIAFRYQNLPTSEKTILQKFGHYYDLSKHMSQEEINNADIIYWNKSTVRDGCKIFKNPSYYDLLKAIKEKIRAGKFLLSDTLKTRSILRIGIHALGSPMWFSDQQHSVLAEIEDLNLFFISLRALMRSAFAVALVTIPSYLYKSHAFKRCIHCSDIAVRLQAFSGTELEHNRYLSDYHGFFHLEKLAAINSFVSKHPGSVKLAFKLRRKKFVVKKLHLPPDIESTDNKKRTETPMMGCGSSERHLLEF